MFHSVTGSMNLEGRGSGIWVVGICKLLTMSLAAIDLLEILGNRSERVLLIRKKIDFHQLKPPTFLPQHSNYKLRRVITTKANLGRFRSTVCHA